MFTGIIIRDTGGADSQVIENYHRVSASRKGVAHPADLGAIGLLTKLGGGTPDLDLPRSSVTEINLPPSGVVGISSDMLVLRIEPAPTTVQQEVSAQSQEQPIIYAPMPTSFSRTPSNKVYSFEFALDSILTPRMMGIDPREWEERVRGRNWIGSFITMLESLAIPLPVFGRKPWLALKHGKDIYGAGRFGLQLESVTVGGRDGGEWQGPNGMQRASIGVRLREFLVV